MKWVAVPKILRFVKFAAMAAAVALALGSGLTAPSGRALAQTPENLPGALEAMRGHVWNGAECCNWQFSWTQKSGPFFRGTWWNTNGQRLAEDDLTINILADNVEIIRSGGSETGGCTYRGKIRVGRAEGDYWCAGRYAGKWGADIR
jgi:hypothetical protein